MILWRMCKRRYATRDIIYAGLGARAEGGRWNRPGIAAVYASQTASLALLETLVHTDAALLPKSLVAVELLVPDGVPERSVGTEELGKDWRSVDDDSCAVLGSRWLTDVEQLVLRVPSAVNPLEGNFILNPAHPDIARCTVGSIHAVEYDPRLIALFS